MKTEIYSPLLHTFCFFSDAEIGRCKQRVRAVSVSARAVVMSMPGRLFDADTRGETPQVVVSGLNLSI